MDKVQFREDPSLLAFVQARGLNPNDVARLAFEAEVQRMKGEDWLGKLRELQKGMRPISREEILRSVREARDEH